VPLLCFFHSGLSTKLSGLLFTYLLLSILTDIASFVIVRGYHQSNLLLIHAWVFVEVLFILVIYLDLLLSRRGAAIGVLLLVLAYITIRLALPYDYNSSFALLSSCVILFLGIKYFGVLMDRQVEADLLSDCMFWINSAIVFYFGVSLFISVSEAYLIKANPVLTKFIWIFQLSANILFHFLLAAGIWKTRRA
jgi:hypothetical protein